MLITISKTLEKDIMNFIELNKIEDANSFLSVCLRDGFNIAKYGYSPKDNYIKENKPFKINDYEGKESDVEGLEGNEEIRKSCSEGETSSKEESVEQKKEGKESVKQKKKIKIIKK